MIQKELAKDEKLKAEDWSRFLPTFAKKNVPRKKPAGPKKEPRVYTPFPPAQTPRKVDLQLETGEYFATEDQRKAKQIYDKKKKSKIISNEKRKLRVDESEAVPVKKSRKEEDGGADAKKASSTSSVNLDNLKANIEKRTAKPKETQVSDFVKTSESSKKKKRKSKD